MNFSIQVSDPKDLLIKARNYKSENNLLLARSAYLDAIDNLKSLLARFEYPERYRANLKLIEDELCHLEYQLYTKRNGTYIMIIKENSTGHSYEKLFGDYFRVGENQEIHIQETFILNWAQFNNLVNLFEVIVKECKHIKCIRLFTVDQKYKMGKHNKNEMSKRQAFDQENALRKLANEMKVERNIKFSYHFRNKIHDRWIFLSNGVKFQLGMGLDIYQNEFKRFIGKHEYDLRKCKECTITVFDTLISDDLL